MRTPNYGTPYFRKLPSSPTTSAPCLLATAGFRAFAAAQQTKVPEGARAAPEGAGEGGREPKIVKKRCAKGCDDKGCRRKGLGLSAWESTTNLDLS